MTIVVHIQNFLEQFPAVVIVGNSRTVEKPVTQHFRSLQASIVIEFLIAIAVFKVYDLLVLAPNRCHPESGLGLLGKKGYDQFLVNC
jgi:hypothetical protein